MISATISSQSTASSWIYRAYNFIWALWAFTESDVATFAIPNTIFGILGSQSGCFTIDGTAVAAKSILQRIPLAFAYNWCNLLLFDMANQRSAISVAEDTANKPWRPIPSGMITAEHTRQVMLALVPLILCFHLYLDLWEFGLGIQAGIWVYNELGGGDEAFIREIVISLGYAVFNYGSLQIIVGNQSEVNMQAKVWTAIVSGVILTTMQVQDLKDQRGDRIRGRKSIVLFLGEGFSRGSIAFFTCFWSYICCWFWGFTPWTCALVTGPGAIVVWSVLTRRGFDQDRRTWWLWCFWHTCLYVLPILNLMCTR